jgi:hypothetical protein
MFCADERTDKLTEKHDEATSRFCNFATASKNLDTPFLLLIAAGLPKRHL